MYRHLARLDFALVALVFLFGCAGEPEPPAYLAINSEYTGASSCADCHQAEYDAWVGSHHDLAMDHATVDTVLGDFDDAAFEHDGVVSAFSRRGDEFWVRTEGPDGAPTDYRVDYVFGVDPLQQYLVAFPGGRYQALPIAWDARTTSQNGQGWFHLYSEETPAPGDPLHWTGINQNWNYMCAECHSTDLRKGYDASSDTYDTTWAEIDVSCEACHGPGSRHVGWARHVEGLEGEALEAAWGDAGLVVQLGERDDPVWTFDETGIARRQPARTSGTQVETCGRCHSRRGVLRADYEHGAPLADSHRVSLLEGGLYHPDGQILDEVYVYGSFLQSRMYAEGVTCSDCHDPHSGGLWNEGNAVCAKCHLPAKYDSEAHHRHDPESPAGECVRCHMRSETYMVVDPRRDHSFRVPRPDLSLELGTPNGCTDCHRETSPEWAAESFREWYPERAAAPHYGRAIHAGRSAQPDAGRQLEAIASDPGQPGIVRASAISLLAGRLDARSANTLGGAARDPDPLVRMATATVLPELEPETALATGRPLLDDPLLSVRVAAANSLLEIPARLVGPDDAAALGAALEELRATQLVNADRPEARIVLGALHARAGELAEARAEYERALELAPWSSTARINFADLHRQTGNEAEAERLLREAVDLEPESADAHHALGLALVRQGRPEEALDELALAAELAPESLRYGYVHAVAAHSTGRIPRAIRVLETLHQRWPENPEVVVALANFYAQMGGFVEAEAWAETLVELMPGDPQAEALLAQIRDRLQR